MTATTNPKSAPPTHGTCRLIPTCALPLPAALDAGEAMLSIRPQRGVSANYTVLRLADADGRTVGFRLTKLAWYIVDRKLYDIDVTPGYGWQCDCPDAHFHNHECKHVRSHRAALSAAGIDVAVPQRQPAGEAPSKPATGAEQSATVKPEPATASKPETCCHECGRPCEGFYCDKHDWI